MTEYAGAILQSGKTKFSIENATKTRVVLADTRIHILGSFQNIRVCRYLIQSHSPTCTTYHCMLGHELRPVIVCPHICQKYSHFAKPERV